MFGEFYCVVVTIVCDYYNQREEDYVDEWEDVDDYVCGVLVDAVVDGVVDCGDKYSEACICYYYVQNW